MVMIRAAFDASMDNPRGITAIAGYIASADAWAQIEAEWNERLKLWDLAAFRLTDVLYQMGNERGWDCAASFASVLNRIKPRYVSACLRDADWEELELDSEYRNIYRQKQHACLDMLLGVLDEDVALEFKGERISVVFDNDYGNTEDAARVYEAWRARTGRPGFPAINFIKGQTDWEVVPLQCADLAAGLVRLDPFTDYSLSPKTRESVPSHKTWLALKALNSGRGAMWSIELAQHTEEIRRKAREQGKIP